MILKRNAICDNLLNDVIYYMQYNNVFYNTMQSDNALKAQCVIFTADSCILLKACISKTLQQKTVHFLFSLLFIDKILVEPTDKHKG